MSAVRWTAYRRGQRPDRHHKRPLRTEASDDQPEGNVGHGEGCF